MTRSERFEIAAAVAFASTVWSFTAAYLSASVVFYTIGFGELAAVVLFLIAAHRFR